MIDSLPAIPPRLPVNNRWRRAVPLAAPLDWLAQGYADFRINSGTSLAYGAIIFVVSWVFVAGLYRFEQEAILLPALAAFLVVGPLLALGLYEKSRRLKEGRSVGFLAMLFVRPAAGGQVLFTGVLLGLLAVLWIRAAVLIYALFFGYLPFPGAGQLVQQVFMTPTGLAMVAVGAAVGGLFAAFAFAISAFSIPMMLEEDVDALSAMGRSFALAWHNRTVVSIWGALLSAAFVFCLLTGLVGLLLVFPILGHATYHAYRAMWATPAVVQEV